MEEKIYERQVTKETLSQRVIDEHQIDRHFTFADLQELYLFKPDRLGDPNAPKRPTPAVPKVSQAALSFRTGSSTSKSINAIIFYAFALAHNVPVTAASLTRVTHPHRTCCWPSC